MASLIPARGKDYKNIASVKADWEAGEDFSLEHMGMSTYCSIRDVKAIVAQYGTIIIRYGKQKKVYVP